MKAVFVLFLTLIYVANSYSICGFVEDKIWNGYKLNYKKNYGTFLEEEIRKQIFFDNWGKILKHNEKYEKGLVTFSLAMNQFGDMTNYEFVQKMNGFKKSSQTEKSALSQLDELEQLEGATFIEPANVVLPDQVDWRTQGAVTPIKDQGRCGSCWAFSATGSLEGQHFRHNNTLISLSEQNLIDCSGKYGNHGCHGGTMNKAFTYVQMNNGLDTEESYPYDAEDESCKYDPRNRGAVDAGYVNIPQFDEQKLQVAVATVGPISVAIDANSNEFQFYRSGVFYNPTCSSMLLNHGVLVVGYGSESGQPYWLVKNSWGETWGDKGYIKMARNRGNHCGIATGASYPLVK